MARIKKKNGADAAPMTTSQMLGSVLKSARDIMRKDKGLNGDLDRLPLLTWIMFLKFLDDLEQQRKEEASLSGKKFKAAIEAPYRWRDWAADPQGITGDELLSFINAEEAVRADGKKGPGLFAYLRSLSSSNGDNRRDVIATVFKGVDNRMKSGYLLRDIVNKVNGIHFTSSDELHTLGALYESMLREMRDAAGDSGEFYTPRPVVRLMVEMTDPQLGEMILDPAAGTGGFLVEAYTHLATQVKTIADRKSLQNGSLFGYEPKSLPYLLCQMNLLLHGLDAPQIDPGNALRFKLSEIGEKDRVDVILTNPPFGGEEERGIQGNFPDDRRTAETALLFLQLIMRRLHRHPTRAGRPARAAVVVPESVMSDSGIAQRIRQQLVEEMKLHTIVRLPRGVFEPYSDIQTNLLFFDTSGATDVVWFYQHEVPEARRSMRDPKYTVTSPIGYDELVPILKWKAKKKTSDLAWYVNRKEIVECAYSFDFRNPSRKNKSATPAADLSACLRAPIKTLDDQVHTLTSTSKEIDDLPQSSWQRLPLSRLLERVRIEAEVDDDTSYQQITVKLYGKGVIQRTTLLGREIKTRPQILAHAGDLIMSRIDARNGAFGIIPPELDGALVTQDFPMFRIDPDKILPEYLALLLKSEEFTEICKRASRGTTNRKRLKEALLLSETVPLPDIKTQKKLMAFATSAASLAWSARSIAESADEIERSVCNLMLKL